MQKKIDQPYNRIIDANLNRAKEGLRVCEDTCRFIFDNKGLTRNYKNVRHSLTDAMAPLKIPQIIASRNIQGDVGKESSVSELKRKNAQDVFYANSQRVKESIRVLEEFMKISHPKAATKIKLLRYKIYALEKQIITKN